MWQIAYDCLDISEDGEIHTVKGELGDKDFTTHYSKSVTTR